MRRLLIVATAFLFVMTSGGCNDDDNESSTTTTSVPASSTTSGAPDTTAAAGTSSAPKTPEEAARGMYDAWQAKDREKARQFATPEAIESLFSQRGGGMTFESCTPEGGQFDCAYRYEGGALHFTVEDRPEGGYVVAFARFVVD